MGEGEITSAIDRVAGGGARTGGGFVGFSRQTGAYARSTDANAAKGVLTDWAASYLTSVLTGGIMAGCLLCPATERQVPRAGLSAFVRPCRASSPGAIRPMDEDVDGAMADRSAGDWLVEDKLWFTFVLGNLRTVGPRDLTRRRARVRREPTWRIEREANEPTRLFQAVGGARECPRNERPARFIRPGFCALRHPHPLTGGDREASRVGDQARGKPWRGS